MTTFIRSLTLPAAVFEIPAASILLPIALGTAVGFSTQRMSKPPISRQYTADADAANSQRNSGDQHGTQTTSLPPTPSSLRPPLDGPLRPHGLRRLPCLLYWNGAYCVPRKAAPDQARRHLVHHPTWPQPGLDAPLLRRQTPYWSHRWYYCTYWSYRILDIYLGTGRSGCRLGFGSVFGLVGLRDLFECWCRVFEWLEYCWNFKIWIAWYF